MSCQFDADVDHGASGGKKAPTASILSLLPRLTKNCVGLRSSTTLVAGISHLRLPRRGGQSLHRLIRLRPQFDHPQHTSWPSGSDDSITFYQARCVMPVSHPERSWEVICMSGERLQERSSLGFLLLCTLCFEVCSSTVFVFNQSTVRRIVPICLAPLSGGSQLMLDL